MRPTLQHSQKGSLKLGVIHDIGEHRRRFLLTALMLLLRDGMVVVDACRGKLATVATAHSTAACRHENRVVVESSVTRVPEFSVAILLAFLLIDHLDLYHLQIRGCVEAVVGGTQRFVKEVRLSRCQVSAIG